MTGNQIFADALLKAGNTDAAEQEARKILEASPHDRGALQVLIEAAIQKSDYRRALLMAEEWISREPDCVQAHHDYIRALLKCGKKRQADRAIDRFEADFPRERELCDAMRLGLAYARGNTSDTLNDLKEMRQRYGASVVLDLAEAQTKSRAGRMIGASRAADRVLKEDPQNAHALHIKAVNAFRLCRFARARHYARKMCEVDPRRSAIAKEIVYASFAAYFPPFLLAQISVMLYVFLFEVPIKNFWIFAIFVGYFVGPILILPFFFFIDYLAETSRIPHFHEIFFWSMGVWIVYAMFLFQRVPRWFGRKRNIELSRNY